MVGGGEEDGSCVRRGHRGNWGDITTTMTYLTISFYSPEVNCAMSVLSEAILVLFGQGSARACVLGLGGCPVAVTVYPPGRGCLHSAPRAQSPGCVRYHSAEAGSSARRGMFTPRNTAFPPANYQPLSCHFAHHSFR